MENSLRPGDRLKHFVIKKLIGSGGMGDVYLAHDESLSRDVAIKTLKIDPELYGENMDTVRRFLSEAKVLAQLQDPSITTIYYISKAEEKFPFIVMEYLQGHSLKEYYETQPVDLELALEVLIQVSKGLQIVHQKGIIHRDIKPANLFKTENGYIKILDFGIAKWLDDPGRAETRTNQFVGSLMYTPPEVFKGSASNERLDIYSLGITLMTMIVGEQPFDGGTSYEVMDQIQNSQARFPNKIKAKLPGEFVDLIYQMVEKDPRDRPQSMQQVYERANQIKLGATNAKGLSFNIQDDSDVVDVETNELNEILYEKQKTQKRQRLTATHKTLKASKVRKAKEKKKSKALSPAAAALIFFLGIAFAAFLNRSKLKKAAQVEPPKPAVEQQKVEEAAQYREEEVVQVGEPEMDSPEKKSNEDFELEVEPSGEEANIPQVSNLAEALKVAQDKRIPKLAISLRSISERVEKRRAEGKPLNMVEERFVPNIVQEMNKGDYAAAEERAIKALGVLKMFENKYGNGNNNGSYGNRGRMPSRSRGNFKGRRRYDRQ